MKEYKIGEVFTTRDGKTVQCVRSNGLCTGCVFSGIGTCNDALCIPRERTDGNYVKFKERVTED